MKKTIEQVIRETRVVVSVKTSRTWARSLAVRPTTKRPGGTR